MIRHTKRFSCWIVIAADKLMTDTFDESQLARSLRLVDGDSFGGSWRKAIWFSSSLRNIDARIFKAQRKILYRPLDCLFNQEEAAFEILTLFHRNVTPSQSIILVLRHSWWIYRIRHFVAGHNAFSKTMFKSYLLLSVWKHSFREKRIYPAHRDSGSEPVHTTSDALDV